MYTNLPDGKEDWDGKLLLQLNKEVSGVFVFALICDGSSFGMIEGWNNCDNTYITLSIGSPLHLHQSIYFLPHYLTYIANKPKHTLALNMVIVI